jgi:hypothetical protein
VAFDAGPPVARIASGRLVLGRTPRILRLAGGRRSQRAVSLSDGGGETIIREPTLGLALPGGVQTHLEVIRFAGANRLLVELRYMGSTRRIEPYSLRRTQEGNIVLHAHNLDRNEHRSYRADRIEGARTINQTRPSCRATALNLRRPVQ